MHTDTPSRRSEHKHYWKKLLRTRRFYVGVFLFVFFVSAAQLLYPADRALPFMRLGGSPMGGQTFDQAVETVRYDYANTPVTVAVDGKPPFKTTSAEAGVVPHYRHAAQSVTEYSLAARFVPFSSVYKILKNHPVPYELDEANFETFHEKFAMYCAAKPKDASLVFDKGSVFIDSSTKGRICDQASVRGALLGLVLKKQGTATTVMARAVPPSISDGDLQMQLGAAKLSIAAGVTVRTSKDSWVVPKETVASWLTTKDTDGKIALAVKQDAIKTYLDSLRGSLYVEPGVTTVNYLDGKEVSRVLGTNGQGIDLEATSDRISKVLLGTSQTDRTAWVRLTVLPPKLHENREYSTTSAGLQAMIEQWEREHPARYGLMVRDLGGRGMNAEFNGDRDFVAASTYKMFLAYAIMHKIEQSELSFDTKTDMGLSVRACIDEMILHSTNACATSLMNLGGWSYVHTFIKNQFPSTLLDNGSSRDNEKHTTVRDAVNFQTQLIAGQLMSTDNTAYMLGLMKRQVYRSGIPRGVPGVTVANKVGFYDGYKHDIGIVYAERGTYVFGMLTYGGNDGQISELSRKVYDFLNR